MIGRYVFAIILFRVETVCRRDSKIDHSIQIIVLHVKIFDPEMSGFLFSL